MDTAASSGPGNGAASRPRRWSARSVTTIILSTVLLFGTAWTWFWMHTGSRFFAHYFATRHCYVIDLHPRGVCVAIARYQGAPPLLGTPGSGLHYELLAVDPSTQFASDFDARIGFNAGTWVDAGYGGKTYFVQFPYWAPAILLTLPILWHLHKSRRKYPAGFCQRCGYDLRATPDRCPECGMSA